MNKKSLLLLFLIIFFMTYFPAHCKSVELSDCNIDRETCDFFDRYYGVSLSWLLSDAPEFQKIYETFFQIDSLYDGDIQLWVDIDEYEKVDKIVIMITDDGIKKLGAYPDIFSAIEIGLRYLGIDGMNSQSTDEDGIITLEYNNGITVFVGEQDGDYILMAEKE